MKLKLRTERKSFSKRQQLDLEQKSAQGPHCVFNSARKYHNRFDTPLTLRD